MFKGLMGDARAIAERDPAAKSLIEVILLYPGFHALFFHRIAHWLYKSKIFFIARFVSQFSRFITGIEIHPGAEIGKGLFIDHGMGVVIGETAYIGDNCTIYHGVTLGGTGKHKGKRHPTIGNNVLIGTGAKLLGPITVGDNTMVGAGSVLLDDVEPFTTVTGPKARAVKKAGKKVMPSIELDHIHVPDPVSQEVCRIDLRLSRLEEILKAAEAIESGTGEISENQSENNQIDDIGANE